MFNIIFKKTISGILALVILSATVFWLSGFMPRPFTVFPESVAGQTEAFGITFDVELRENDAFLIREMINMGLSDRQIRNWINNR